MKMEESYVYPNEALLMIEGRYRLEESSRDDPLKDALI